MKQILCFTVFILGITTAFSQKEKPIQQAPAAVVAAFQQQFPQAAKVTWEKEKTGYEASFTLNGSAQSATFDQKGTLQETEIEIPSDNLPQAARTYIWQHYAGQQIKEATKITAAGGSVTFEAEVHHTDLIFDSRGRFLKAIKK